MDDPDGTTLSNCRWAGLWGRGSVKPLAIMRATFGMVMLLLLPILAVGMEMFSVLGKVPEKRLVEADSPTSSTVPSTGLSGANDT